MAQEIGSDSMLAVGRSFSAEGYAYEEGEAADFDGAVADESVGADDSAVLSADAPNTSRRRLIFTGDMTAVVTDTQSAIRDITAWLVERGGFVEQSRLSGSPGAEHASLQLRVPVADYEALRALVRELADEVNRDESRREDVTARRADMDARLENLRLAENELRELLESMRESGADMESILEVYRELSNYRGEIEGLEAQLAALDEQVSLSTLSLELHPVRQLAEREARRWQIGRSVRYAWVDLVDGLQGMAEGLLYFLIAVLPRLLIWLGLLWLAWLLVKPLLRLLGWRRPSFKVDTRRKRKAEAKAHSDPPTSTDKS